MSENGPDNLVLRYLRSIDERLERLERDTDRRFTALEARFSALEARLAALETRLAAIEDWTRDATSGGSI